MKIRILLMLALTLAITGNCQVLLQVQLPPAGLISKDALWNITLVNQGDDGLVAVMRMSLQEVGSGQVVLSAGTGSVLLKKGPGIITVNDLTPISYNYGSGDFNKPFLPLGIYNACYQVFRLVSDREELVGEECVRFTVEPLSPPLLAAPADGSEIQSPYPAFSWIPPAPLTLFSELNYDLLVVEVLPGQTPAEALQLNLPMYNRENLNRTNEPYPAAGPKLDTARTYAWQVIARNNSSYAAKTEAWTFRVAGSSVPIVAPIAEGYILMRPDLNGTYTIPGRLLHIKYLSYHKEYKAHLVYTDEKDDIIDEGDQVIQTGENFLDLQLRARFKEGKIYRLTLLDPSKKTSQVRFIIK